MSERRAIMPPVVERRAAVPDEGFVHEIRARLTLVMRRVTIVSA